MKRSSYQWKAAAIACLGMVLPPAAFATTGVNRHGDPEGQASSLPRGELRIDDVALRPGGLLVGQVVDSQGVGQAGAGVSIQFGEHEVVRTSTDRNGVFAAQGLRGGQYQVVTPVGHSVCRLWAEGTAPPAARQSVVVTAHQHVVRGQWGGGRSMVHWMRAHPYLTTGTIAAAIAIPLAVSEHHDWPPSS